MDYKQLINGIKNEDWGLLLDLAQPSAEYLRKYNKGMNVNPEKSTLTTLLKHSKATKDLTDSIDVTPLAKEVVFYFFENRQK